MGRAFEYTGYVESINIKGVGANSHQFLFSLVDPKVEYWPFLLDVASEPLRYTAMANLVIAAHAANRNVRINTVKNADGPRYATEIEIVRGT